LPLCRKAGGKRTEAVVSNSIGNVHKRKEEFPKSREILSQALRIMEELRNKKLIDLILIDSISVSIGISLYYEGQFKTALDSFNKISSSVSNSRNKFDESKVLGYRGFIKYRFGEHKEGCALVKEALKITREIEDKLFEGYLQKNLSEMQCDFE